MANKTRQAKWKRSKKWAQTGFWKSRYWLAHGKLSKGITYDPHKKVERAWAEWAKRRKEREAA